MVLGYQGWFKLFPNVVNNWSYYIKYFAVCIICFLIVRNVISDEVNDWSCTSCFDLWCTFSITCNCRGFYEKYLEIEYFVPLNPLKHSKTGLGVLRIIISRTSHSQFFSFDQLLIDVFFYSSDFHIVMFYSI